jgi:hypothetical protein
MGSGNDSQDPLKIQPPASGRGEQFGIAANPSIGNLSGELGPEHGQRGVPIPLPAMWESTIALS